MMIHNDSNGCTQTGVGKYSAGVDRKTSAECKADSTKGDKDIPSDDASWFGVGLTSAAACRWKCDSGYKEQDDGGTISCVGPSVAGKYIDGSGAEEDCDAVTGTGTHTFVDPVGGRSKTDSCDFTCESGKQKVNSDGTRVCSDAQVKHFVDADGEAHDCAKDNAGEARNAPAGATGWANSQAGVLKRDDCKIAGCTANDKVLDVAETACENLPQNSYKDTTTQKAVPCGNVHASVTAAGGAWAASQDGVSSVGNCKVECGSNVNFDATGDTTGTDAQCEKKCSLGNSGADFGNAPENSGRKVWDSNAWSATCKPTVCDAGYDYFDVNNATGDACTKTIAGYWSAANDKDRTDCKNKPSNDASSEWLVASDGLANEVDDCNWSCKTGYKENGESGQDLDCVPEVPTVTSVTVSDLVDIGNSKNGTKDKDLTVAIVGASKVSHYYLTHVVPSTFTPTDTTKTDGTNTWSTTVPDGYTLTSDGTYTLYLWVADVTGAVIGSETASDPFVLDTTAPSTPTIGDIKPTKPKDTGAEAQFSALTSVDESGGTVIFSILCTTRYC